MQCKGLVPDVTTYNQLTVLAVAFGQLAAFQTVGLQDNKLTKLPKSSGQLAAVRTWSARVTG